MKDAILLTKAVVIPRALGSSALFTGNLEVFANAGQPTFLLAAEKCMWSRKHRAPCRRKTPRVPI